MTITYYIYELAETAGASILTPYFVFFWAGAYITLLLVTTVLLCPVWVQGLLPRDINWFKKKKKQPSPSKIYAQSLPCIMISYAPHLRAYRLWDPATSLVFNSYHVTFFKHLNAMPSCLLPRTILGTDHASSPPTWEVTGPQILSDPTHPPLPSFPYSSFSNDPNLPNPSHQTSFTPTQTNLLNPPSSDNSSQNNDNTNTEQQHLNEEQQLPNQEQQLPQSLIPHLTKSHPSPHNKDSPPHQAACLCTTANIADHIHLPSLANTSLCTTHMTLCPLIYPLMTPHLHSLMDHSNRKLTPMMSRYGHRHQFPWVALNLSGLSFTLPPHSIGNSTNLTSKQLSSMGFYLKMKPCSWNNHLVLRFQARRSGWWNW